MSSSYRGAHWPTRIIWLTCLCLVLVTLRSIAYYHPIPSYKDGFGHEKSSEWKPLGGAWQIENGIMTNRSDERGVKLVTGSQQWQNYVVEADVRLLSGWGDAGLLVRSKDEERGVDSYDGYYVGVRILDGSLVAGRGNHGWMEALPVHMPEGVQAFRWYHLKIVAFGCDVGAVVGQTGVASAAALTLHEDNCALRGRIGLRSVSTGAAWRNVSVRPATQRDIAAVIALSGGKPSPPEFPISEAAFNATHRFPTMDAAPVDEEKRISPLPELKSISVLDSPDHPSSQRVRVRGVVTLTTPRLYVQDASGGIEVLTTHIPPLNLGDEVEVLGAPGHGTSSATIEADEIHPLWDRTPVAPLAISSSQAATGAFNSSLVETQGTLHSIENLSNGSIALDMDDGSQSFRAVASELSAKSLLQLAPNSLLRISGVCTMDKALTNSAVPFAILLRSREDVNILAGPPWWSARRLAQLALVLLFLTLIVLYLYTRLDNWRWQSIVLERERLAHDLHDTLAQSFAGVSFQLQGIRRSIRSDAVHDRLRAGEQLDLAYEMVRQTHEEASLTIAMLRQEILERKDLAAALQEVASRIVALGSVEIVVEASPDSRILPLRTSDAFFHIGREAIVNAIRHSGTTRIEVSIEHTKAAIFMTVTDFGCGFDPVSHPDGFGIRGMKKRAQDIGADLKITSSDSGTRIQVAGKLATPGSLRQWAQAFLSKRASLHSYTSPLRPGTGG